MNYFGQNFMKLLEVPLPSSLILIHIFYAVLNFRGAFYAKQNREVNDKKKSGFIIKALILYLNISASILMKP